MKLGRYQLVERLAVGGMAELYKARVIGAHGFQKPVVIKKILPHLAADAAFVAMFIDEANITARLDHPKIAQVLELGTIQDQLYMAMEYVDGIDVLAMLRQSAGMGQPLPPDIAAHVAHEVLDALDYAHQVRDEEGHPLGIVHRDISPSNVLISRRGDVKLADFGIAHAVERQQKTQAGTLKGKYGYMSPEQVVGSDLDGRSDLFSVSILLAEMLMGRHLFTAPNHLDVLLMVRDVRLERLEKYGTAINADLRKILLKGLARDPRERFATAGAFRDTLAEWLYRQKRRVGPGDLASFVEGLFGGEFPRPAAASPPGSSAVGPSPGRVSSAPSMPSAPGSIPTAGSSATTSRPAAGPASRPMIGRPESRTTASATARALRETSAAPAPRAARHPMDSIGDIPIVLDLGQLQPPTPGTGSTPSSRPSIPVVDDEILVVASEAQPQPAAEAPQAVEDRFSLDESSAGDRLSPPVEAEDPFASLDAPPAARARVPPAVEPESGAGSSDDTFSEEPTRPGSKSSGDPSLPVEEMAAAGGGTRSPAEPDLSDLSDQIGLERAAPTPIAVVAVRSPAIGPATQMSIPKAAATMGAIELPPDEEGDLAHTSPISLLYRLAVDRETGLLVIEISAMVKELFLVGGVPEYVRSNVAREFLGEYLVAKKVISSGELAMALAMMPHFGGKIGDTLVGLGLMKPLDVFRHLSQQVREKIIDALTWQKGHYRYYRGRKNPREAFPLGLDAFEVLGAGAMSLSAETVEAWAAPMMSRVLFAAANAPAVMLESFRLGGEPGRLLDLLDGQRTLRELLGGVLRSDERLNLLRVLYLLVQINSVVGSDEDG
jgi:serine/threonine protein kinase